MLLQKKITRYFIVFFFLILDLSNSQAHSYYANSFRLLFNENEFKICTQYEIKNKCNLLSMEKPDSCFIW